MSLIANGISYRHHPHSPFLFENLTLSVPEGAKVSLIGPNGAGKTTLLHLLAGRLSPATGSLVRSSTPYLVPQQTAPDRRNVAELLGIAHKLRALRAICSGSVEPDDFETLGDDWEIEAQSRAALNAWGLSHVALDTPSDALSGGERTKTLLAGWTLHDPAIVLLDEPTNHLDRTARARLYDLVARTRATLIVVSHDTTLLNLLHTTCELTPAGLRFYGGNYDFYREQRDIEEQALAERIEAGQAALRAARKQAQEVRERQERRSAQGERNKSKAGLPRIIVNARRSQAQNSTARLRDRHTALVDDTRQRLADLRERQVQRGELKIDFHDAALHTGKRLIRVEGLNFGYPGRAQLWPRPFDLELRSGDRLHIAGDNGSGKTTFVRLLLGELSPTAGRVERAAISTLYLDQEYRLLDSPLSVVEMARRYNARGWADHELKTRLDRALFPRASWDKPCRTLSGGERMRLMLCCLMIADHKPDLFVLDEPTNNLDIDSLAILTDTLRDYRGSLVVISHDDRFVREIGVTETVELSIG